MNEKGGFAAAALTDWSSISKYVVDFCLFEPYTDLCPL